MKKNIILILIFLAIVFGVFIWQYKFKNTQNKETSTNPIEIKQPQMDGETKKNNTYINEKYKYKLEYPSDFEFREYGNSISVVFSPTNILEQNVSSSFRIQINSDISFTGTTSDLRNNWRGYNSLQKYDIYPDLEEKKIINGNEINILVYETNKNSFSIEKFIPELIYITNNDFIYEITGTRLPSDTTGLTETELTQMREYQSIFEKMLNSFTFFD